MMIKYIDGDEWYPVYDFADTGFALELTEDEVSQIEDAFDAFNAAQTLVRERLVERGAFTPSGMRTGNWYAKPGDQNSDTP